MLAALAGIVQPALGLMGVGMLCTLDSAARVYILTGGLFRWNTINFILVLVALLFLRRLATLRIAPAKAALLLLLYLLVGLAFSTDLVHGLQHLAGLVGFFGILVYTLRGGTPEGWYWTAVVCGVLGACGGFVFNLQKSDLPFINPNAWSYFPVTAILTVCIALSFRDATTGIPARRARGDQWCLGLSVGQPGCHPHHGPMRGLHRDRRERGRQPRASGRRRRGRDRPDAPVRDPKRVRAQARGEAPRA